MGAALDKESGSFGPILAEPRDYPRILHDCAFPAPSSSALLAMRSIYLGELALTFGMVGRPTIPCSEQTAMPSPSSSPATNNTQRRRPVACSECRRHKVSLRREIAATG
jgi:hypothetical protein